MMRRFLLILLIAVIVSPIIAQDAVWPSEIWQTSSPEAQGMSSAILADAMVAIREDEIAMSSLLVIRNGYVVLDVQFYPFESDNLYNVNFVTSSFVTTLVGIALDHGELESLDTPMVTFFQDYEITNPSPLREMITVDHLMIGRSGLSGDVILRDQENWVDYALNADILGTPGETGSVSGGNIQLVASIIENVSETPLFDYAQTYLFESIGISSARWDTDPQGIPDAGIGLYLTPHDMARFGYLFLNEGNWNGEQIVSAEWVETATMPHPQIMAWDLRYGWYKPNDENFYCALGGRVYMCIFPDLELLFVVTGDSSNTDVWEYIPMAVQGETELSDNPDAQARLQAEISAAQVPQPLPVPEDHDIQSEIAGKRYSFEDNPLGWQVASLTFDEATAELELETIYGNYTFQISLDGVYRVNEVNMPDRFIADAPLAIRGQWAKFGSTFNIDAIYLDEAEHWKYRFIYGDDLSLQVFAYEDVLARNLNTNYTLTGTPE